MKKVLLILTVIVVSAVMFSGCGGTKNAATDIVPNDAAETLLNGVTFKDTLVEAPGEVAKEYYRFDDKVTDYAVYMSGSGATAEEIAVIKTSDLKTAEETVKKRLADLEFSFKDYVPAEMTKIGNPVIKASGDIVVLVVADDAAEAQKAVDDLFNGKTK